MTIEAKIRRASLMIAAGLFLQFVSLLPIHPLAFIAFVGLGVPVTIAGVILFLLSLIGEAEPSGKSLRSANYRWRSGA